MLAHQLLLLSALAAGPPSDTVVLQLPEALRLAQTSSLRLEAAALRAGSALQGIGAARSWATPQLGASVENLGAPEPFGGPGLRGVEGQFVVSGLIPVGGDRRAGIAQARARHQASTAASDLVRHEVLAGTLAAIVAAERDRDLASQAAEERAAIEVFADALRKGVAAGRFPAGDAARAEGALVQAATEEARRRASLAVSEADLALALGLPPGTAVRVVVDGACTRDGAGAGGEIVSLPDSRLAAARLSEAEAALALSRARAVPDLYPQLGLRRSGGLDGVYLGLAFDLPFSPGNTRRTAAARDERDATAAERSALERDLAAERAATAARLQALEAVGALFSAAWSAALDLSVSAGLASYQLGDGSLGDLLQTRRARLEALRDHTNWLAETRVTRIQAARFENRPLDERALCAIHP
jgi:outer membrane protein, heavy metal efflux system